MIVAGINFLRLYRVVVQRRFRMFAADEELRLYLAFAVVGSALVIFELLARGTESGAAALRHGSFQAVAVILGVDAFMDMARTSINLLGNCLASAVMARWEGELAPAR